MRAKRDEQWWQCLCGRYLPDAPEASGGAVLCDCGRLWSYGYWALDRWPGDSGATPLEPRLVATYNLAKEQDTA